MYAIRSYYVTKDQDEVKSKEYLDELEFLTYTAGGEVVKRFTQKMDMPNSKTFLGTGKIEEVERFIKDNEIGVITSYSIHYTKLYDRWAGIENI